MKNINKYLIFTILILIFSFLVIKPIQLKAFEPAQIVDPFCWFACEDDDDDKKPKTAVAGLSYSCSPNTSSVYKNGSATWTAKVSGGYAPYRYYWSQTLNVMDSGYGNTISKTYSTTGYKAMSVAVIDASTSRNVRQSDWVHCNGTVAVTEKEPEIQTPTPTITIIASPSSINYNESSIISWSSTDATYCVASGGANDWPGEMYTSGSFSSGPLTNTTTFYMNCSNSAGSINNYVTINVSNRIQNPTVTITASPGNIDYNESSVISWSSTNATSCNASGGTNGWSGNRNTSGTFYTGNLRNTTTFYMSCSNSSGIINDSIRINVNEDNQYEEDPTVSIYASQSSLDYNESTTIYWDSDNATSCKASGGTNGWSGNRNTSGTFYTGNLRNTTTFYINCKNGSQTSSDSVRINVNDEDNNYNNNLSVDTKNATNITSYGATLNGSVDGDNDYTTAWFAYGTNRNSLYSTTQNSRKYGSFNHNATITGLSPNTTYYFRLIAENSEDIVYGDILSFNTIGNYIDSQPTVVLSADNTSVSYNGITNIRWYTTNATSCYASLGSNGWAGVKSIGPGSFYTGSLTGTKTYTMTCSNASGNSSSDSVKVTVREEIVTTTTKPKTNLTSLLLVTSSLDRNQAIVPTLDNTKPRPGDEINYTLNYQNAGNGGITNLIIQMILPQEVIYLSSNGKNPNIMGNNIIFNIGTLKANEQGSTTVKVLVKNTALIGTTLNFPVVLSYIDASNNPQSVNANVSAQIWGEPISTTETITENIENTIGANVFGSGFMPGNIFGWLILVILILLLILISKNIFNLGKDSSVNKKTTSAH